MQLPPCTETTVAWYLYPFCMQLTSVLTSRPINAPATALLNTTTTAVVGVVCNWTSRTFPCFSVDTTAGCGEFIDVRKFTRSQGLLGAVGVHPLDPDPLIPAPQKVYDVSLNLYCPDDENDLQHHTTDPMACKSKFNEFNASRFMRSTYCYKFRAGRCRRRECPDALGKHVGAILQLP